MLTLVLELELAAASTSANRPASAALSPKAVSASVTISEVDARFSPEAAARFIMPSRPPSISLVFHPAMAMYSRACPASLAVKDVVAPICLALSASCSIWPPSAPEMAPTADI